MAPFWKKVNASRALLEVEEQATRFLNGVGAHRSPNKEERTERTNKPGDGGSRGVEKGTDHRHHTSRDSDRAPAGLAKISGFEARQAARVGNGREGVASGPDQHHVPQGIYNGGCDLTATPFSRPTLRAVPDRHAETVTNVVPIPETDLAIELAQIGIVLDNEQAARVQRDLGGTPHAYYLAQVSRRREELLAVGRQFLPGLAVKMAPSVAEKWKLEQRAGPVKEPWRPSDARTQRMRRNANYVRRMRGLPEIDCEAK